MLLFYLRHGEPIYKPDSLTPQGVLQANALAKRLCLFGIDKIYSSPSQRALDTSKPTCEMLRKQPIILDWCDEAVAAKDFFIRDQKAWCFQILELKKQFLSQEVLSLGKKWYEHPYFENYNFKNGILRVDTETDAFFKELGYEHDRENGVYHCIAPTNDRVALFAHQGFGEIFLSSLLDIPYPMFSTHFDMAHSSMSVIEFSNCDGICIPKVLQLSNDSHLYREGLPTYYNNFFRF